MTSHGFHAVDFLKSSGKRSDTSLLSLNECLSFPDIIGKLIFNLFNRFLIWFNFFSGIFSTLFQRFYKKFYDLPQIYEILLIIIAKVYRSFDNL
jgi:hypothetical protein